MYEPSRYLEALAPLDLPDAWQVAVEVRPRRKRIEFQVRPGGQVTILVPPKADPDLVVAALTFRRFEIARNVREMQRVPRQPVKRFVDDEPYQLLGRTHRLQVTDGQAAALKDDRLLVPRGTSDEMCRAVVEIYRDAGLAWMHRFGEPYLRSGLIAPGLTFAVTKYTRRKRGAAQQRVGSYTASKHGVTLHWALFGFPLEEIECTFVHELTHATNPPGTDHGRAWQHQFTLWMSDWRERRKKSSDALSKAWFGAYPEPITGRLS